MQQTAHAAPPQSLECLHVGLSLWSTQEPVAPTTVPGMCPSDTPWQHWRGSLFCPAPHQGVVFYQGIYGHCELSKTAASSLSFTGSSLVQSSPFHLKRNKAWKNPASSKPVDQQYLDSARDPHCRILPLCHPSSSSFSLLENPTAMKRKSFVCQGPCLHLTSIPGKNDDILIFLNLILIMLVIRILISN